MGIQSAKECWNSQAIRVADIVRHAGAVAIPTFQRGNVWASEPAAVKDLLRSLSRHYFVGTMLIWRGAVADHAKPLVPGANPEWLLLDGQQRIRSLIAALYPPRSLPTQTAPDRGRFARGKVWCVRKSKEGLDFERRSFSPGAASYDGIPLALLPSVQKCWPASATPPDGYIWTFKEDSAGATAVGGSGRQTWADVAWNVVAWQQTFPPGPSDFDDLDKAVQAALLDAQVNVHELPSVDEQEVIDNYRRLNATGARLRDEELEYARLVAAAGNAVTEALGEVVRCRPGGVGVDLRADDIFETEEDAVDRDDELARGPERDFGLALLVRAVRLARDLDEGARRESSRGLGEALDSSAARAWLADARAALCALSETLESLHCDFRSALPKNTAVFGSLLAMLLRFPALRASSPWAVAQRRMLSLGLFLNPGEAPPERVVFESVTAFEAVERLHAWLTGADLGLKGTEGRLQTALSFNTLKEALQKPGVVGGPHVDLLYWLLRSKGAHDIRRDGAQDLVTGKLSPQRQHIIPFTRVNYENTSPPRRTSTHWVNSVGNLTWISAAANTFVGAGWGSEFMVADEAARQKHLLNVGEIEVSYDHVRKSTGESSMVAEAQLEAFAYTRAAGIAEELWNWWRQLEAEAQALNHMDVPEEVVRGPSNPKTLLDNLASLEFKPHLARVAADALTRMAYQHGSTANGWKGDSRHRIRWTRDKFGGDSIEAEFRGPGETKSRDVRLVISRGALVLPALDATLSPVTYNARSPDEGELQLCIHHLESLRKGW